MRIAAALAVTLLLAVLAVALAPEAVLGQTDEIQVYNGDLAGTGKFNLTLHNNYTPSGSQTPSFPGALVSDRSLNGVPEWAYGVTDWFEAGLYLPLYSIGTRNGSRSAMIDGAKLRALFAVPHAGDRPFFYGVNFEFSRNASQWDAARFTSEIRPIVGWHLRRMEFIVNPIFDTSWDGVGNLDFAPSTRIGFTASSAWAFAAEEYDDFGHVRGFLPGSQQSHQLFGVVDHSARGIDMEAGAGFGLNSATDRFTLKLILSRDLN